MRHNLNRPRLEGTTPGCRLLTGSHCISERAQIGKLGWRLGTGAINVPNTHPAAVAASIAMLDHLFEGRCNFGISPGVVPSDAEVLGNLDNDRNALFMEGIEVVLKVWASQAPYDINGKFWNVAAKRTLMPEIGQGIMPKWVAKHWTKYIEGCENGNREALAENCRVASNIFVADDLAITSATVACLQAVDAANAARCGSPDVMLLVVPALPLATIVACFCQMWRRRGFSCTEIDD
jgi:hypothetical protein